MAGREAKNEGGKMVEERKGGRESDEGRAVGWVGGWEDGRGKRRMGGWMGEWGLGIN